MKQQPSKLSCKCNYCCLTPLENHPNSSFDHQNSTNIATNSSTFQYDFATATISSLYPQTHFSNPEALPTLQQSFKRFTTAFPQYLNTVECDQIRANDFPHISKNSHACLDYSGHGLFSSSSRTRKDHFEVSNSIVCEHRSAVELMFESRIKTRISKYLNVSEDDYSLFFTANQTSALRCVAESYPFKDSRNLVTVYDHENEAVDTMLETSKNNGARVSTPEFKWPKFKVHCKKLEEILMGNLNVKSKKSKGLFVFPIQSRISGVKYSYQWMSFARENGWHVLLDATSLGPKDMDTLGLSLFQPDFIICTFYKVFGDDPSGFSCLLVKNSDPSVLDQSYFSSARGIVAMVPAGHQGVDPDDQQMSGQQSGIIESNGGVDLGDPQISGQQSGIMGNNEGIDPGDQRTSRQQSGITRNNEGMDLGDPQTSGQQSGIMGNNKGVDPGDQHVIGQQSGIKENGKGVDPGDQRSSGHQSEIVENNEGCCIELALGYVESSVDDQQILGPQSEITENEGSCIELAMDDGDSSLDNQQTSGHQSEITCEALDHADSLGLALISTRTRCLVNWLVNALLCLNHPRSDEDVELIQVYGPKVRFDRGPSLAFNVFDWKGEKVDPLLVQKLADRHNISLGFGCLKHVWFSERYEVERNRVMDKKSTKGVKMKKFEGKKREKVKNELSVVVVSIGYLTNFEDVYRVWEFVAKFLDADFVEKERWRYVALNQKNYSHLKRLLRQW